MLRTSGEACRRHVRHSQEERGKVSLAVGTCVVGQNVISNVHIRTAIQMLDATSDQFIVRQSRRLLEDSWD